MITRLNKPYAEEAINSSLTPLVKNWFYNKFENYSPPQKFSILNIKKRKNTLISSPTGSGKTLSSFLAIIDDLVKQAQDETLEERVYCIYISPLKALGNDIEKNLLEPLKELNEQNNEELGIRVGVRTGDTTKSARASMLKKPPHILITTPESFSIMLTTPKFSTLLTDTDYVIVDEVHALADNKRGTHLSLSLERLADKTSFVRIGLSATISPLEEVAKFLVGQENGKSRPCDIVDVNYTKKLDIKVLSPVPNLISEEHHVIYNEMYRLINELVQQHRTTLIFTNTRAATERVVHHLSTKFPGIYTDHIEKIDESDEIGEVRTTIAAHHGSLSKEKRLRVEEQLRNGELKCVVSSTSLELGIDIGYVDLVILLGSPKSVARALQRIGRSGHKLHETAKGRIIVLDRDDLVECTVLARAALQGSIDNINIPKNALDILSQEIYAQAIEKQTTINDIYRIVTSAYPYKHLSRKQFGQVIKYLAGEYAALEDRHVYAKIWYDEDTGNIGKRGRMARVLYMTNVGTIPDQTNVIVKVGVTPIGSITEPFLEHLKPGDVFVLGGETYQFKFARGMTAQVVAVAGKKPTVPSWFSEMLPLSFELASHILTFRKYMEELLQQKKSQQEIIEWLEQTYPLGRSTATSIYEYFKQQYLYATIPTTNKLVIEHFHDNNRKYAVIHSLYGRRVNDVLARGMAFAAGKIGSGDVEMGINDNGFYLQYGNTANTKRALKLLHTEQLREVMYRALERTEVLARRFRHCAGRSLMILRTYKGKQKTVGKQQVSSQILISTIRRMDKEFPIYTEAKREVLEDLMDITNTEHVLKQIEDGTIKIEEIHTKIPSPFAFNLVLQGYADVMKMEERHEFIRRMHQEVLAAIALKKSKKEFEEIIHPRDFSYEYHWKEEEKELQKKEEDHTLLLKEQLYAAARKQELPANIVRETQKLIEGEKGRYSKQYIEWLGKLLTETIPKSYGDELIQFLQKKLPEIGWN